MMEDRLLKPYQGINSLPYFLTESHSGAGRNPERYASPLRSSSSQRVRLGSGLRRNDAWEAIFVLCVISKTRNLTRLPWPRPL